MNSEEAYQADYTSTIAWARAMLADPQAVILDTETTGLDGSAEICQIAILGIDGTVYLDTLVKPTRSIPKQATNIHGITDAMVANAPTMEALYDQIIALLSDRQVIIYNADYDVRLLQQSLAPYRKSIDLPNVMCAMLSYSAYVGDWNDYHGNYRWQRLPGGDHSALGDCKATLKVIRKMAEEQVK